MKALPAGEVAGSVAVSVIDRVLTTISRYSMLRPGNRVVAAVSGGADSVFLLIALLELAPRIGAPVAGVAHLNHKLRGEASDADERFVAALAKRHGIPFHHHEARIAEAGGNLEQAARRARIDFFESLIREGKANRIATGHTLDDQAETVLFRMLRGSGLTGLAAIAPATGGGVIRPLLEISRAEIEDFLRGRGMEWREDASNREPRFARNRIRHDLLPQLEREWNPELRRTLARMADLAREEERWWDRRIARLAKERVIEAEGALEIQAGIVARLPKPVARRLVRHLLRRCGSSADFNRSGKILELAGSPRGSGRLELPSVLVTRSFDWLRIERRVSRGSNTEPETIRLEVRPGFRGRYAWNGGFVCVTAELAPKTPPSGCVRLKWKGQQASAFLQLRGWNPGDRYRPCGALRDQKLKEMFQTARIPSWKRRLWPIVTFGSKILWAREFGAAAGSAEAAAGNAGSVARQPGTRSGRKAGSTGVREAGCSAGELWLRIWEESAFENGKNAQVTNHLPPIQRL